MDAWDKKDLTCVCPVLCVRWEVVQMSERRSRGYLWVVAEGRQNAMALWQPEMYPSTFGCSAMGLDQIIFWLH